jgi:hypothetical protein
MSRPNHTQIAVLKHTLLGIAPPAGSAGAMSVRLRRAGTCFSHQPVVDISHVPVRLARCAGCGRGMELGESGDWEIPLTGNGLGTA